MASPSLLRSAAVRVLRRSTLQVPSARSPRVFFSGVAGKIEPCKLACRDRICCLDMLLGRYEAQLLETRVLVDTLLEEERRFQQNERLQKKISCVLLPATAALWIFGPEKEKLPAEGQSSI